MVIYQDCNSYCYNSDTHFLYDFISRCLSDFRNNTGEVLDVGSGSGILGFLIARDFPKLKLSQIEIYPKMQFLSQKNSQVNNIKANLFCGDFATFDFQQKFDLVISNPPFYHSGAIKSQNEHKATARSNDSLSLEKFIKKSSSILKENGKFAFCYDVKQIVDIIKILGEVGLNAEKIQFVHPKNNKKASLVMIFARKNTKSLATILSPLVAFDGLDYSKEVQNIYKKSATHSIKVEL